MAPFPLQLLAAILALGNAVFLVRAGASPLLAFGLTSALGLGLGLLLQGRDRVRLDGWRTYAVCTALALAICLLGGEGHFFFTTDDWTVRDAVLADMTHGPWPVTYREGGGAWLLRAPLGLYVLPGLAGRVFGLGAAHLALLAQDTVMLAAILVLLVQGLEGAWRRAVLVLVFFAFSGWDVVGQLWAWRSWHAHGLQLGFPLHIERWSVEMEYSSFITDLFWAPNHALPALAFAAAYLCWRRGRCSAPALAGLAALCLLWSPLAVMGAAPFVLLALVKDLRAGALRPLELGGAALLGASLLPVAIYLTLDSGSVVHGFTPAEPHFWPMFVLFLVLEVAPLLYLLLRRNRGEEALDPVETALVCAMLLLIPLYRLGISNDFMMRASIVPLALAAATVGRRLVQRVEGAQWGEVAAAALVLAVGAVTPALQVARSLYYPPSPPVTASMPYAWTHSVYGRDPMGTYLAPVHALDRYSWLFRPATAEPPLRHAMR